MNNTYLPKIAKIERIVKETADTKTFYLKERLDFVPGQFVEVSCLGMGEAPISISSSPDEKFLKLTFRRAGCVTTGLFNLKVNDSLGIRGPFGNGFPIRRLDKKDILLVAGGIGLAPLWSLLKFLLSQKKERLSRISLLYGARHPKEMLYKKELRRLAKIIEVKLTVDKADNSWKQDIGVVPELLNKIKIEPHKTKAFLCGPGLMLRFTVAKLLESGIKPGDIVLSLERQMKCGIGKCGHCYISDKFVCRDGPVFTCAQLNNLVPGEIL